MKDTDIALEKAGSLKLFHRGIQTVRGVLHKGKFTFIIPHVDVDNESAFWFEGSNAEEGGVLKGTGKVLHHGSAKGNNTFSFCMKRLPPTPVEIRRSNGNSP